MVQVRVSEGLLQGELVNNDYGGTFCSFKGVPFAEPPLGDLRFKAPQPPKPWEGIRSAKEFGSKCYQSDPFVKAGKIGSEDCLYLNVYTPTITPDKLLPVMFFIHGGAFTSGSGEDYLYGPEFLVRNPTPDDSLGVKWTPYTLDNQDYMDIGNLLITGTAPQAEEIHFWENLYKEYGL